MKSYDFNQDHERTQFLEAFTVASYVFSVSLGFMVSAHCFLRPFHPPYLLFSIDHRFVSLPVYLVACSWFSWFAVGVTSILGTFPFHGIIYMGYIVPIIKNELRIGLKAYRTDNSLRELDHLVVNWRSLEIFLKYVNCEIGFSLMYLQIVFIQIILFCIVTLLFQWNELRWNTILFLINIAIYATCGWSAFLMIAGMQYSYSKDTIDSWRIECWQTKEDRMYVERVKYSCRPFSIGDGRRYFIRPITVLSYLRSVSRNTFRALITCSDFL